MTKHIEIEGCAKTLNEAIEKALEKALAELNLTREEIEYELLDQKKSGFFGLGEKIVTVRVSYEEKEQSAKERAEVFLAGLFTRMNAVAKANITEGEDGRLDIILEGEDMGIVIGRRGETLDAIQYLTSLAVNKGAEKHVRVTVNTENYREKREDYLTRLANKTAERVLKYKRNITMEPMVSHDRRVIHACLQDTEKVKTYSVGQEPNRRVVIAYDGPDARQRPVGAGENQNNGPRRRPNHTRRPNRASQETKPAETNTEA